jgi:hypothetical protein
MTFDGEVSFYDTAALNIELGGTTPGEQFDQLLVSGTLSLGGTLNVSFLNGFNPAASDSFNILDWGSLAGTFNAIQLPSLSNGLEWDTSQLYTDGVLSVDSAGLPGDFNFDGAVDAADYVAWRKTGVNGATGYDTWRAHFSESAGSGSGVTANTTVPEQATMVMLIVMVSGVSTRRRWSTRRVSKRRSSDCQSQKHFLWTCRGAHSPSTSA